MADFSTLTDPELIRAHVRSHSIEKSLDSLATHHLLCAELVDRYIDHQHAADDPWSVPLDVSKQFGIDVVKEIDNPDLPVALVAALRQALYQGIKFADVIAVLSLNGYELTVQSSDDPTLNVDHIVADMTGNTRPDSPDGASVLDPTVDADPTNCPDCADGSCTCGDDCDCWQGCTCPDCDDDEDEDGSALSRLGSTLIDIMGRALGTTTDAEKSVKKAKITKTEGGFAFPSAAYAYTPHIHKAVTWKVRLWESPSKKETASQVSAAVKALTSANIPAADLPGVKKKVLAAWKKTHGTDPVPASLKAGTTVQEDAASDGSGGVSVNTVHVDAIMGGKKRRIAKSVDEKQFTLAPWYIPDQIDAHDEWTDPETLQQACWDYVDGGDREIRLQHNTDVVAGRWVEIMQIPYKVTFPMLQADGTSEDVEFPMGTIFMGVIWENWAWQLIKDGKITGLSIGGTAERVPMDLAKSEEGESFEPSVSDQIMEAMKNVTPNITINMPESKKTISKKIIRDTNGQIVEVQEQEI